MVILIDTTQEHRGTEIAEKLAATGAEFKLIETQDMNISYCAGCNFCWLKTPGECVIKDDYEPILRQINDARQVWVIADTTFGFINYRAKNIYDRIMPILTMGLEFRDKLMRHIMRYDNYADWGVIYTGEGDKAHLDWWCEKMTANVHSSSLGAHSIDKVEEAIACMQ